MRTSPGDAWVDLPAGNVEVRPVELILHPPVAVKAKEASRCSLHRLRFSSISDILAIV